MRDVEDRDDHAVAVEVVTRAPVALTVETEEGSVQRGRGFEVGHLDRDAEQLRHRGQHNAPFAVERGPDERHRS